MRKGTKQNPIDVRKEDTRLFTNISIETGAACNRRCAFCPQHNSPREDEWMSEEMFDRIISNLEDLNYKQRITINSYNEPMRDERLHRFLLEIRGRLPRVWIIMNTNGDYLRGPKDIERLFDCGLNGLQINCYSTADGSGDLVRIGKGNEKAEQRYQQIQKWVDMVGPRLTDASIYSHAGAYEERCQVMRKYDLQPEDVADHANTAPAVKHGETVRNHISNRCGSIPQFVEAMPEPLKKMCVRPFRAFMINWRGDSYVCCNDYYGEATFGNIMDRRIEEMFNDPRFHAYRIKLQAKNRDIFLCDKCDYTGGFYQHNVPHITMGEEEDERIIDADLRSKEDAGF